MSKHIEFDCTGTGDRIAVNDFLAHVVRSLPRKAFKLVSDRNEDGSFSILITGDGSEPGEAKQAIETPKPARKRTRKSDPVVETQAAEPAEPEAIDPEECCEPE
jgi:hypothetical protein